MENDPATVDLVALGLMPTVAVRFTLLTYSEACEAARLRS